MCTKFGLDLAVSRRDIIACRRLCGDIKGAVSTESSDDGPLKDLQYLLGVVPILLGRRCPCTSTLHDCSTGFGLLTIVGAQVHIVSKGREVFGGRRNQCCGLVSFLRE